MESMIERLYHGLIKPCEIKTEDILYLDRKKDFAGLITQLKMLAGDNKQMLLLLSELKVVAEDIEDFRGEDMYFRGFSMGMRIAAEAILKSEN